MPSPLLLKGRRSEIGQYYAVTCCTHARSLFFRDPVAAQSVISELRRAHAEGIVSTFSWVVMPDHLHWLFCLESTTLSKVIQRMKCASANRINAAFDRQGAIWQPGFFDHRVRTSDDLDRQARYMIENPVRAGIVLAAEDYPYWGCVGFR